MKNHAGPASKKKLPRKVKKYATPGHEPKKTLPGPPKAYGNVFLSYFVCISFVFPLYLAFVHVFPSYFLCVSLVFSLCAAPAQAQAQPDRLRKWPSAILLVRQCFFFTFSERHCKTNAFLILFRTDTVKPMLLLYFFGAILQNQCFLNTFSDR